MQKFTDLLENEGYQLSRTGVETKAYVERKGTGPDDDDNTGGNQGGSNNPPLGELEG
jgi:hypothetical protein